MGSWSEGGRRSGGRAVGRSERIHTALPAEGVVGCGVPPWGVVRMGGTARCGVVGGCHRPPPAISFPYPNTQPNGNSGKPGKTMMNLVLPTIHRRARPLP